MDYLADIEARTAKRHQERKEQDLSSKSKVGTTETSTTATKCNHSRIYNELCMSCGSRVSLQEQGQYRQYKMVGHEGVLLKEEYGSELINAKKELLLHQQKLVLVLDIDNTLLHSQEVPRESVPKLHKQPEPYYFFRLYDPQLSIYEFRFGHFVYYVKMRPFLVNFLKESSQIFEIYFYTAAVRDYGLNMMQMFAKEIQRQDDEFFKSGLQFLSPTRLIARDDIAKYQSEKERQKAYTVSIMESNQTGKRAQMGMQFVSKTLSSLAGGDDSIFIILDDRSDVWLVDGEVTNRDGVKVATQTVSKNLLKIPGYYYHPTKKIEKQNFLNQAYREIAAAEDLDIALPFFAEILKKVHTNFFNEAKYDKDVKKVISVIKHQVFQNAKSAVFDYLIKPEALAHSFEGHICKSLGLKVGLDFDMKGKQVFVCPDNISQKEVKDIRELQEAMPSIDIECLSVYWLYMSHHFMSELDSVPFKTFKGSSQNETKRIAELLKQVLKHHFPLYYSQYVTLRQSTLQKQVSEKDTTSLVRGASEEKWSPKVSESVLGKRKNGDIIEDEVLNEKVK